MAQPKQEAYLNLPWHRESGAYEYVTGSDGNTVAVCDTEEQADFITRAGNLHDELVAALLAVEAAGVLFVWANEKGIGQDEWKRRCVVVDAVTDAITKAKGE